MTTLSRIVSLLVLGASPILAQTPTLVETVGSTPEARVAAGAPDNPWVGANLSYQFGNGSAKWDDLVGNGSVTLLNKKWTASGWQLPIMGTLTSLSLDDLKDAKKKLSGLLDGDDGMSFGAFPYRYLKGTNTADNTLTFYGQASVKVNTATDSTTKKKQTLGQFRVAPGFEGQFNRQGAHTLTLAVAPMFAYMTSGSSYKTIFGKDRSWHTTLDVMGTIRLFKGVGFLLETSVPYGATASDIKTTYRGGFLFAGQAK